MKTPKTILHCPAKSSPPEEVETERFLKLLAKDHNLKFDEYFKEYYVKIALNPDDFEVAEEEKTAAEIKEEKKVIAAISKAFADSEKLYAKAKADEEAAEAAKQNEGKAIILAAHEGMVVAGSVVENTVNWLQSAVGDKFVVTESGLKLTKGVTATKEDYARVISGLTQTNNSMDVAKVTVVRALGDALALAKKEIGDDAEYDLLVENAVSEHGKAKHTVQQAVRLAERSYPVIPGWSYTHYQEFMNYTGKVKDEEELASLMKELAKGKDTTITVDGKKIKSRVPFSCPELRHELQTKFGKLSGGGNGSTPSTTPKYIYLSKDREAFSSDDLSMEACSNGDFVAVVDVKLNAYIDADGNVSKHLKPLPRKYFQADVKAVKEASKEPETAEDEMP